MQTSHLKIVCYTIILSFMLSSFAYSQRHEGRPPKDKKQRMEKIQQIKKIKLLEILELDEENSNKVLAKYDFWEKKLFEKRKLIETETEALKELIGNKSSKSDISKKTQLIMQYETEFCTLINEKHNAMKSLLNEVDFAKYIVFENKFQEELKKVLMDRPRKPDMDEDD